MVWICVARKEGGFLFSDAEAGENLFQDLLVYGRIRLLDRGYRLICGTQHHSDDFLIAGGKFAIGIVKCSVSGTKIELWDNLKALVAKKKAEGGPAE